MIIVPLYASFLAVLFIVLSIRVILVRRVNNVGFGTGSDGELRRRVRIHANFTEYVPFALILLSMAEFRGAPPRLASFALRDAIDRACCSRMGVREIERR